MVLFMVACGGTTSARAGVFDWEESSQVQLRMWIPDDQDVIYGFYLSFNESGGDTRLDLTEGQFQRYRDYAQTMGFGLIGTQFSDRENDNDVNHSDTVIEAMNDFAEMSGHPEIANAPVITEGISLGGHNAIKFAAVHPERTIAYLGGGISYLPTEVDNPAFARVPGFFYQGETDTDPEGHLADFLNLRSDAI
ncbi:MAG TPA: hypothetical protein VKB80_27190, partial [Kofleriaceae bacterium]|nr:hypothetical protein [Kofleriaceae bacterium]